MTTAKSKTVSRQKPIPVIDLAADYRALKSKIDAAVGRVLASGSYILGEETRHLEEALAVYCGTRHAVAMNSGTDAIHLALRALGVGPGDEVILPAMTFIATAEPVAQLGARPVFADIDSRTYTLDPAAIEKKISPRTKAIIAVHLYGQPAEIDALQALAANHRIPLIEDMAQAIGSDYKGKKVGGFGTLACLSFYPTKNLGAAGDGGMVLTSDENLAFRLRRLRNHGARVKYDHEELGYNSRLDELQAAILRVKLSSLERWNQKRIALAKEYTAALRALPLQLPYSANDRKHVFHLFSVCTPHRDALHGFLKDHQIHSGIHYPKPLHLQAVFKSLGGKPGDFPNSERLANETLSLPLHPHLRRNEIQRVAGAVRDFFKTRGSR